MPDLDLLAERGLQPDPNKAPIDDSMGPHGYVESEFPEGAKLLRCDRCGGGPDAAIHQKPVDQMERIADALERIASAMDAFVELAHDCTQPCEHGRAVHVTERE